MATRAIEAIRATMSLHGEIREMYGREAASATFLAGAPLCWSGGYLTECGTDPAVIVGIAAEAAHNTTAGPSNVVRYWPLAGNIFEANLSQAATGTTSAVTHLGVDFGIIARSSGTAHWVVDSSDETNTCCTVLEFAKDNVIGDVSARVLISFHAAHDGLLIAS